MLKLIFNPIFFFCSPLPSLVTAETDMPIYFNKVVCSLFFYFAYTHEILLLKFAIIKFILLY